MSEMLDCVCVLTVQTMPQYAMKHGACKISESVSIFTKIVVQHPHKARKVRVVNNDCRGRCL